MTESTAIELPDRMDITNVEEVHRQLEEALLLEKPVVLKGQEVVRLDTAALQMLVGFRAEAATHHLEVSWDNPSRTIEDIVTLMQLGPSLGLYDQEAGAIQ